MTGGTDPGLDEPDKSCAHWPEQTRQLRERLTGAQTHTCQKYLWWRVSIPDPELERQMGGRTDDGWVSGWTDGGWMDA